MNRPNGFTLVEMLVSVALVLLMMSLFAQVFVEATNSLSTQRGIAENDQRGRLLATTLRGDLDARTFRDVFPFRAGEDTRKLGHSLVRRSGYFEVDEGDPNDSTDDVLSFTTSVNIRLQNKDATPKYGVAISLGRMSSVPVTGGNTLTFAGDVTSMVAVDSRVWIEGTPNQPYKVTAVNLSGTSTNVVLGAPVPTTPVNVFLSESDPDFDDGVLGNGVSVSAFAEVCYFLRNNILYRRVLLIRDTAAGRSAQPVWSTGSPMLWNGVVERYPVSGNATTFWRDLDYSAFYFTGKNSGVGPQGVCFHNSSESLSNSSQAPLALVDDTNTPIRSFPISLGVPHLRFGHSITNGLPQDASTVATLNGNPISIGRFNLQECSNSTFGYPGNIANGNPFNRTNLVVDPITKLVQGYDTQVERRGEDILLSNVLTFDVKVFDSNTNTFVDLGDNNAPIPAGLSAPPFGSASVGRLNTTYGAANHFRFDTWHPLASAGTNPSGNDYEPPFVPFDAATMRSVPLSSIQITINYRDVSSGQIRQVSIIQSLMDQTKLPVVTSQAPEE